MLTSPNTVQALATPNTLTLKQRRLAAANLAKLVHSRGPAGMAQALLNTPNPLIRQSTAGVDNHRFKLSIEQLSESSLQTLKSQLDQFCERDYWEGRTEVMASWVVCSSEVQAGALYRQLCMY